MINKDATKALQQRKLLRMGRGRKGQKKGRDEGTGLER